jgi:hypothetical protein
MALRVVNDAMSGGEIDKPTEPEDVNGANGSWRG